MLPLLERYVGWVVPGTSTTNCTCVSSSLCLDGDIITDGAGVFNLRRFCSLGQVCCPHPLPASTSTAATTTSTTSNTFTSGCGLTDSTLTSRFNPKITSSTSSSLTTLGEFPWMAALLETDSGGFLCGGSLVGEKVVLTAAHCVAGRAPASLTVRLGEWDASSTSESLAYQDVRVTAVRIHPSYYPPGVFYDLALLGLEVAADTNRANIGLECLPSNDSAAQTYQLDQCLVIGWGKETFASAAISAVLKKIQVPTKLCLLLIMFPSGSHNRPPGLPVSAAVCQARLQVPPPRVVPVCRRSGWAGCLHWGWWGSSHVSSRLGTKQDDSDWSRQLGSPVRDGCPRGLR